MDEALYSISALAELLALSGSSQLTRFTQTKYNNKATTSIYVDNSVAFYQRHTAHSASLFLSQPVYAVN